ncbi:MAG: IclR family transcriptional regulator [Hoeflea sp.]|nr:IclR family transcriptional regulator [Hoeflea sp.]
MAAYEPGVKSKAGGRNGIQVISRAAAILRVLRDQPQGLSLAQIAERVDLARSTVQRIVAALQTERLIITIGNGGIRLGPEITALAEATKVSVVEFCRPFLLDITRATGETADLSVLQGHQLIFLDQVAGTHRLRAISAVGDKFPLTDTANGRAILAAMSFEDAEQYALMEWDLAGKGGDWADLREKLVTTAKTGLAYDIDEHTVGISAIGIAFTDWIGVPHAISVPIPSTRFDGQRQRVQAALLEAKAKVTKAIRAT